MTTRTDSQNNSLHLWFRQLAQAMNDADVDMEALFRAKKVSVPMTDDAVKNYIWKPIQEFMYSTKSTTDLDKIEQIDTIYDTLNRHFASSEELSKVIFPPFPSEEE